MDKLDIDVLKSRLKDMEHGLRYVINSLDDEVDIEELTIKEIRLSIRCQVEAVAALTNQLHQLSITQEMLK